MSNQIDILKIRSELEKNIRELTNSYTQLQISHFETSFLLLYDDCFESNMETLLG